MNGLKVLLAAAIATGLSLSPPARAADPVKVALIADSTGPLEAYAKQTITGFQLGLEYATKGTMTVAGRKIEVIVKDSQTKPDVGRNMLSEAFGDQDADIAVGGTSSAVALAMLPVAQEYKKDPDRRARRGRRDHRRQVEPLHLPHQPQLLAGRDRQRGGDRQARHRGRHPGPGLRLRPRRRGGLPHRAGRHRRQTGARGIRAAQHDRFHRPRPAHLRRPGQGDRAARCCS